MHAASDGLVEMLCQGMRAGISASAYCHANELQKHDKDLIDFTLIRYSVITIIKGH